MVFSRRNDQESRSARLKEEAAKLRMDKKERAGVHGDNYEFERKPSGGDLEEARRLDMAADAPEKVEEFDRMIPSVQKERDKVREELHKIREELESVAQRSAHLPGSTESSSIHSLEDLERDIERKKQQLKRKKERRGFFDKVASVFGKEPDEERELQQQIEEIVSKIKSIDAGKAASSSVGADRSFLERQIEGLEKKLHELDHVIEDAHAKREQFKQHLS